MKTPESKFVHALEVFRNEVSEAIQCFYTLRTIETILAEDKDCLNAINTTPLFWKTNIGALQAAFFIVLGRIFDKSSKYNLNSLLAMAENHTEIFSKDALAARKRKNNVNAHEWLDEYLKSAYVPVDSDFRRLRKHEKRFLEVYRRNYSDIRHKYYAHKVKVKRDEIQKLFSKTNVSELEKLLVSLNKFYDALLEMLINGRKPILRPMPYSVNAIKGRTMPEWQSDEVQERAVKATQKFFRTFMIRVD